jgi:hypothetical protein
MKILIISPTPTHPTNAGNRSRILNICQILRNKGFDVHFLYIKKEEYSYDSMFSFFNKGLFIYESDDPFVYFQKPPCFARIASWLLSKFGFIHNDYFNRFKYNKNIDDYFPRGLPKYISDNLDVTSYDYLLVNYVVFSRAVFCFPDNVIRILDTHDVLTNRYLNYLNIGLEPRWYSLHKRQEAIGLNRFDIVWAIQDGELNYFKKLTTSKACLFPYIPSINCGFTVCEPNILFLGSSNVINIDGLRHFISDILPILDGFNLNFKIFVAGSVCDFKNEFPHHPSVSYCGEISDMIDFFKKGSIFINPIRTGTGIKIKTIDALFFGKCVVSYKCGVEGLMDFDSDSVYYKLVSDEYGFALELKALVENEDYLRSQLNITKDFRTAYLNYYNIDECFTVN